MIVLALDVASRTGAAWDSPSGGPPRGAVLRIPPPAGSSAEGWVYGPTFAAYERELGKTIDDVKPDEAVFETPVIIGGGAGMMKIKTSQTTIRILHGLAAITEMVFERRGIPLCEENIMTIKKHFAGHGRADKKAMIARCVLLGWDCGGDDNVADAMALWSVFKSRREPRWNYGDTPLFRGRQ